MEDGAVSEAITESPHELDEYVRRGQRREALNKPCPYCGAEVGKSCTRSGGGMRKDPHNARLKSPRISIGGLSHKNTEDASHRPRVIFRPGGADRFRRALIDGADVFRREQLKPEPESQPELAIVRDAKEKVAAAFQDEFDRASLIVGSPIERIMLAQLMHPDTAMACGCKVKICFIPSDIQTTKLHKGLFIFPQQEIGPYKVDFHLLYLNGYIRNLIVECDGHEFHEKTKEQAQRDKARDRYMLSRGAPVIRFTGSEIYNDPARAVNEAISIILGTPCHG